MEKVATGGHGAASAVGLDCATTEEDDANDTQRIRAATETRVGPFGDMSGLLGKGLNVVIRLSWGRSPSQARAASGTPSRGLASSRTLGDIRGL
jgi:hypothetical protein